MIQLKNFLARFGLTSYSYTNSKTMEEAKKFVESTISSKPVVVFSKSYCPFCVKIMKLFQEDLAIPDDKLEILQIEDRPDCADLQAYLKEKTGASSVSIQ